VETCQNWANESADIDPDRARYHQISLQQAKREAAVYQKAYEAALADAERLCPGRTFQSATGIASLGRVDMVTSIRDQKASMAMMERELEALRDWALQLPDEALQAKKLVEEEVESHKRAIEFGKEIIQRDEASLAEHGNQD
jgi:predicted GNAT family N-acyltransferase